MHLVLTLSIIYLLSSANSEQADIAVKNSNSRRVVSFTINANEVADAEYISSGLLERSEKKLNGATSGDFSLPVGVSDTNPTLGVRLTTGDGDIIAEDVVIYKKKEFLLFDAASSARASIFRTAMLVFPDVQSDQLVQLYFRIDDHSRFGELINLYKLEKRLPIDETRGDMAADITADITLDLLNIPSK